MQLEGLGSHSILARVFINFIVCGAAQEDVELRDHVAELLVVGAVRSKTAVELPENAGGLSMVLILGAAFRKPLRSITFRVPYEFLIIRCPPHGAAFAVPRNAELSRGVR